MEEVCTPIPAELPQQEDKVVTEPPPIEKVEESPYPVPEEDIFRSHTVSLAPKPVGANEYPTIVIEDDPDAQIKL